MSTKKPSPIATVVVPTYNGEQYLESLIESVLSQINVSFEFLIIDSGSSDATVEIIKKYPSVKLHQIKNTEFGHGKTRNLAASMASGEFVVYLSQDAVPAHERWLEFMIEAFFINKDIVCVVGKQVPRPFSDAPTKREVSDVFDSLGPDHSIMIHKKDSFVSNTLADRYITFFSDVNSAVRRDFIVNTLPYRDVRYSEDQMLGKDLMDQGYMKAYSPKGTVWHSNEYGISDYFKRKYDEYTGMYESMGVSPQFGKKSLVKLPVVWTLKDFVFIAKDPDYSTLSKLRNLVGSPLRNVLRAYAGFLVSDSRYRKKHGNKYSLEKSKK